MTRRFVLIVLCAVAVRTAATTARREPPQQAVFRSHADLVSVDVSVRNGNVPVAGLGAADFRLSDNGVPQVIDSVSLGAVPIDVTLFLDTSGSTAGDLDHLKADIRKIAAMLRPDDQLRLLTFDSQVHDVFGWRPTGADLPLDTVTESTVSSPVYDALLLAMLRRPDPDRRHLVVAITDGEDNGSWIGSATVRDMARRAEAVLHIVLVAGSFNNVPNGPPGRTMSRSLPDERGSDNLAEAATLTGGKLHSALLPGLRDIIVSSFKDAFDDFRLSYVLRFTPTNVPRDGWHDLHVDVPTSKHYTIRARKGYFGG